MTPARERNRKSRTGHRLWPLGIAMALGSTGCAMDADRVEDDSSLELITIAAAPAATFTAVRPVVDGSIVYEPLAPRTADHAEDAQLSIDVVVRNDQAGTINVDRVRLSYAGPVVPSSVTLEADVLKKCGNEDVVELVSDRAVAPNESCRLVLTPDQKLPIPGPNQVTIQVYFVGFADPVSVTMPLAAHQNDPAEGSYRFPARAEDLAAGHYWSGQSSGAGSHHRPSTSQFYAYDAGVVRWDAVAGEWSSLHPGTSGDLNSDFLVWGQPIYAMADGVVIDFENNQVDNPPGEKLGFGSNFFAIDHGDEIGRYFHLQQGSLNPALRSIGATVTAGQFLGLAGNSGNSDAPHLHVQVDRSGVGMPLLFHEVFLIERNALGAPPDFDAPFTAVEDQGLPWQKNIIWPSPFLRKDQATDVPVSAVAIAPASGSLAVTAARSAAGNLKLESWQVDGDGYIVSKDEEAGGPATEIAIAQPGFSSEVVTAFRDSGGDLELIAWDVTGTGTIERMGEHSAGPISKLAMTRIPVGVGVVTAFRNGSGDLGLIAWELLANGEIEREGDATGDAITDVVVATIQDPFDGVVTAARNGAGNLVLSTWEVTAAKQFIHRDDHVAGAVSKLALAPVRVAFNKELMVTAIRNGSGNLEVNAWEVSATGQIQEVGEVTGGAITDVAVAADGQFQVVSAVRDSGGNVKLIAWEVSAAGDFVREGEASAGAATDLALTSSFSSSGNKFAMPVLRDSAGDLRLISWQTNLKP